MRRCTRFDAELAALFEALFYEAGGAEDHEPSEHRVIPVAQAVKQDVEVQPYDQAVGLIEGAKSWAVRDCICRTQQKLVDKGLRRAAGGVPLVCAGGGVLRRQPSGPGPSPGRRPCPSWAEAADAGLIHTLGNYRENHYYICSCCTCCCGLTGRWSEFAVPSAVAPSAYLVTVDVDACSTCVEHCSCSACEDRCPVKAITVEDVAMVDAGRCIGCGQCTLV